MALPYYVYDVFTTERWKGNPLAVVGSADDLTDAQMQAIAREFGLSETVFLQAPELEGAMAKLRIYTPEAELPFAGHPVVGTAIMMDELSGSASDHCLFELKLGACPIAYSEGGAGRVAQLTAPKAPWREDQDVDLSQLPALFSLKAEDFIHQVAIGLYSAGNAFLVVELASREALTNAEFDSRLSKQLGYRACYCLFQEGQTLHARMLSSIDAIDEDPATGSAAATVPAYLLARDGSALAEGSHQFDIRQGEDMDRASLIKLDFDVAKGEIAEVRIAGSAVKVASGELEVD